MAPKLDFKRSLYPPDDPLKRGEETGSFGDDVLAVKTAIARAGFWPWQEFDEFYSNKFSHGERGWNKPDKGVAGFQRLEGIQATGYYGSETHEALRNTKVPKRKPHAGEWVFDRRARALYNSFEDMSPEEEIVKEIFYWWDILVAKEPAWHYSQYRPVVPLRKKQKPPRPPGILDCSGTVLYTCWLAGAKSPDPFYAYEGWGNTNSMNDGGFHIGSNDIETYCKTHLVLAFYGPSKWNTKHMTAIKSFTEVYSMGNEGAPEKKNSMYLWNNFLECRAYNVL